MAQETGAAPQRYALRTWRVERFATLDSTSEEAKRRALAGDPGRLWIVADQQTAGRGRHGRDWRSPPGNFHGSALAVGALRDGGGAATRLRRRRRRARGDRGSRRQRRSAEMAQRSRRATAPSLPASCSKAGASGRRGSPSPSASASICAWTPRGSRLSHADMSRRSRAARSACASSWRRWSCGSTRGWRRSPAARVLRRCGRNG